MKVALLAPVLSARDAVGNDVLAMAAALREDGTPCASTPNTPPDWPRRCTPVGLADWLRDAADLVIYHCSIGWPRGVDLLARLRCRRVVRYHNITPPEFSTASRLHMCAPAPRDAPHCRSSSRSTRERWLPCSDFNARTCWPWACQPRASTCCPFHRIEVLRDTPPDPDVLDRYGGRACTWLSVGRLAPNKDHATLLDAFALYLRQAEADARLLIVGKHDGRLRPTQRLRARIGGLGIGAHVHLLDDISEAALKAATWSPMRW